MRRAIISAVVSALVAGALAWLAIHGTGTYGWTLFIGVPLLLGYLTTAFLAFGEPRRLSVCIGISLLTGVLLSGGFLLSGMEGLICIAMCVPIASPFITLGSAIAWLLYHRHRVRGVAVSSAMLIALTTLGIALEPSLHRAPSPTFVAADFEEIAATPDEVWTTIVRLSDIEQPDDLFFRVGAACPRATRIVAARNGGLRVCTMSTGTLVERIDRWEPGRRLAWRALSTPPPMKELNPFHDTDPPHLHGFYRNTRGEFAIEALPNGRTRLTRRMWYAVDLYPAAYWRLWCDFGASRIHHLVLGHVRFETEKRRRGETRI
jgi:hypothetical protein